MARKHLIRHIRSSVPGKLPTSQSMELGEFAINTYDGKVYIRKSGSTDEMVTVVTTDSLTTGSVNISGSLILTGSFNVTDNISVGSVSGLTTASHSIVGTDNRNSILGVTGSIVFLNSYKNVSTGDVTASLIDNSIIMVNVYNVQRNEIKKAFDSIIVGGDYRVYDADGSSIFGYGHNVSKNVATYVGGYNNLVNNSYYSLIHGEDIVSSGSYHNLIGGKNNNINDFNFGILGGEDHVATNNSYYNFVMGWSNKVENSWANIVSGYTNTVSGSDYSIIVGLDNVMTAPNSSNWYNIITGERNTMDDGVEHSAIVGGTYNEISGSSDVAVIIGGDSSTIGDGVYGVGIFSGQVSSIDNGAYGCVILGGLYNKMNAGSYNAIVGGEYNTITGNPDSSMIMGRYITINGVDDAIVIGRGYNSSNKITNTTTDSIWLAFRPSTAANIYGIFLNNAGQDMVVTSSVDISGSLGVRNLQSNQGLGEFVVWQSGSGEFKRRNTIAASTSASFADYAMSSSHALYADSADSASSAISASHTLYADNAGTASFAVSASTALYTVTSSYALNADYKWELTGNSYVEGSTYGQEIKRNSIVQISGALDIRKNPYWTELTASVSSPNTHWGVTQLSNGNLLTTHHDPTSTIGGSFLTILEPSGSTVVVPRTLITGSGPVGGTVNWFGNHPWTCALSNGNFFVFWNQRDSNAVRTAHYAIYDNDANVVLDQKIFDDNWGTGFGISTDEQSALQVKSGNVFSVYGDFQPTAKSINTCTTFDVTGSILNTVEFDPEQGNYADIVLIELDHPSDSDKNNVMIVYHLRGSSAAAKYAILDNTGSIVSSSTAITSDPYDSAGATKMPNGNILVVTQDYNSSGMNNHILSQDGTVLESNFIVSASDFGPHVGGANDVYQDWWSRIFLGVSLQSDETYILTGTVWDYNGGSGARQTFFILDNSGNLLYPEMMLKNHFGAGSYPIGHLVSKFNETGSFYIINEDDNIEEIYDYNVPVQILIGEPGYPAVFVPGTVSASQVDLPDGGTVDGVDISEFSSSVATQIQNITTGSSVWSILGDGSISRNSDVRISGSLYLSGSDNMVYGTASWADSASQAVSASSTLYAVTSSYAENYNELWTGSFADGHIERVGNVNVSGALYVSSSLYVVSSSIYLTSGSINEGLGDFVVWESGSGQFKRRTSITTDITLVSPWTGSAGLNTVFLSDNTRNVGVGTSTPITKFHVSGGELRVESASTDPARIMIINTSRFFTASDYTGDQTITYHNSWDVSWAHGVDADDGGKFKIGNLSDQANEMVGQANVDDNTIMTFTTQSLRVGVGTAAPGAKFHVWTKISSSDIETNNDITVGNDLSVTGDTTLTNLTASGNTSITGYVSASSFSGDGAGVTGVISASHAVYADNVDSASSAISSSHTLWADNAGTASFAVSSSHVLYADNADSASVAVSSSHTLWADNAISASHVPVGVGSLWTGSFVDGHIERVGNVYVNGNFTSSNLLVNESASIDGGLTVNGDATINGVLFADELHTSYVSASIIYSSGSTKFGDSADDIHQFTGSIRQSGSAYNYFRSNVGIGTTEPIVTGLHVWNDVSASQFYGSGSNISGIASSSTAVSSSHAIYADNVDSASAAISSSYALFAMSSSHTLYADNADSASTAVSSSHALYADSVGSSSAAISSSYASFAMSSSHTLYADNADSASTAVSSSHALFADSVPLGQGSYWTGSGGEEFDDGHIERVGIVHVSGTLDVNGDVTAPNFVGTASFAISASHTLWADNAISASHVPVGVGSKWSGSDPIYRTGDVRVVGNFTVTGSGGVNADWKVGQDLWLGVVGDPSYIKAQAGNVILTNDVGSNYYAFGDVSGINNETQLILNDASNIASLKNSGGTLKVGINTDNPEVEFDIQGSLTVVGSTTPTTEEKLWMWYDAGSNYGGIDSYHYGISQDRGFYIRGKYTLFQGVGSDPSLPSLFVSGTHVGIGTSAPAVGAQSLHVWSDISASNFYGDGSNLTGISGSTSASFAEYAFSSSQAEFANTAESSSHALYADNADSASRAVSASIADSYLDVLIDIGAVTDDPTGFRAADRTNSSISHSDADLTFYIYPNDGVSFNYYIKGEKFTVAATESVVHDDIQGLHYFYFDNTGTLTATTTFSWDTILKNSAYISFLYWDTGSQDALFVADERHGLSMDVSTHQYLHTTFGTQWVSGLGINVLSIDGDGDVSQSAQIGVSDGVIADEDLRHTITNDLQIINPTGSITIFYKTGSTGNWSTNVADDFPLIHRNSSVSYVNANGLVPYNLNTGGVWSLQETNNQDFILMHYFATNDISYSKIIGIQGQSQYANLASARAGAATEIADIVTSGLPMVEFKALGTVIFQTRTTYDNPPRTRIRTTDAGEDYIDFRTSQPIGTGTSTNEHGSLSGLANDDHVQYVLVDGTRDFEGTSSFAVTSSYSETAVSSSHAVYADNADSASVAVSASSALWSISSSYAENIPPGLGGLWTGSGDFIKRDSDVEISGTLRIDDTIILASGYQGAVGGIRESLIIVSERTPGAILPPSINAITGSIVLVEPYTALTTISRIRSSIVCEFGSNTAKTMDDVEGTLVVGYNHKIQDIQEGIIAGYEIDATYNNYALFALADTSKFYNCANVFASGYDLEISSSYGGYILGGENNRIFDDDNYSGIIGGEGNQMSGSVGYSVILAGDNNHMGGGTYSSAIIGGSACTMDGAAYACVTLGGIRNGMAGGIDGVILGGQDNIVTDDYPDTFLIAGKYIQIGSDDENTFVIGAGNSATNRLVNNNNNSIWLGFRPAAAANIYGIFLENSGQDMVVTSSVDISGSLGLRNLQENAGLSDFVVWDSGSGDFKRRTSGTDGTSGTAGSGGSSGTAGSGGADGTSGTAGSGGSSGTAGSGGTSGADGTSGTAGSGGSSGVDGAAAIWTHSGSADGSESWTYLVTGSDQVGIGISGSEIDAKLHVYSTDTGSRVFLVEGQNGALFQVLDELSGSLFAVSDISGLPILEVFDDDKVVMGKFNTNALVVTGSQVGIGTAAPATGGLHVWTDVSASAFFASASIDEGLTDFIVWDSGSGEFKRRTSGADGTSGTAGSGGSSGTAGSGGADGTSGTAGSGGSSGTAGSGGADGTSGTAGSGGTSGADGTSGTAGSGGTSGADGTSGTAGSGGADGTSGTAGSGGSSGTAGSGGADGTSGTAGSGGTSGVDGATNTWTGSDGLNTVFLVNVGDYVGIGTTTPTAALDVVGDVHISGTLFADAKSFDVGHPTKPGHRLRYGSLEGPEYGVYYRGKNRGNIIELPNYWYNLVDETTISVTVTPYGRPQSLYVVEATNKRIEIRNASWFDKRKPEYYYVIYGERKDIKKLNVEYKK